jgi:hypothetical protein
MIINEEIERKYLEMKSLNINEDYLDKMHFGDLKIFINSEPKSVLFSLEFDGDTVYLGSN